MTRYEIERPEGEELGIRVRCPEHDEATEFDPGRKRGTFYCSGCGFEIEVGVHDPHDWRELSERC